MTRITKNGRLQQKTDLESNWEANDPDILKGEVCVSVNPNDLRKAKVKVATRDGKWSEFDYIGGEGGGGESLWQNGMNEHGLSIKDSKAVVMGNYSAAIGNDVFSNASNSLTVGDYKNHKITFGIDFEEEIDSNTFLYKITSCSIFGNNNDGEKFLNDVNKNYDFYFTSYDRTNKRCVIFYDYSEDAYFIKSFEGDLINGHPSGTTSICSGIQDLGSDNSISVGNSNTILNGSNRSSAFGSENVIFKSVQSFANGTNNLITNSNCSNAFGLSNKIRENNNGFVSGDSNIVEFGFQNDSSFVTGVRNEVYCGYASHTEGYENKLGQTKVYNNGSLEYVNSQADFGHVEGFRNTVGATGAHAEGSQNLASGMSAHAEGQENIASAYGSHAEGYRTIASGNYSHAEGFNTLASGQASHAGGDSCKAIGYNSAVLTGTSNIAEGSNSSILSGVRNKAIAANSSILTGSDGVIGEGGYCSSILTGHVELIAETQFILNESYTAYAYNLWSYNKLYVGDENNRFNLASLAPFTYIIEDQNNLIDSNPLTSTAAVFALSTSNYNNAVTDQSEASITRNDVGKDWFKYYSDPTAMTTTYWFAMFSKDIHKKDVVSNVLCLDEEGKVIKADFVVRDNQEVVVYLSDSSGANTTVIKKIIIS